MPTSIFATLFCAALVCSVTMAAAPYEVKGISLGSNLLEAYKTLKSRYGNAVAVKQWRTLDTETISLIAHRSHCGTNRKTTCEKMTVSSILPLYREQVVRIELSQSFIRRRTEQEVVDSLVQKYGQPFLDQKGQRRNSDSRVMLWCANCKVPTSRFQSADSWFDYRTLESSFIVTEFDMAPDGGVSGLTMVSENPELLKKNQSALMAGADRIKQALIRDELKF